MSVPVGASSAWRHRTSAGLILAVAATALALYYPTLRASFAYDDVDYFNAAAEHLSGRTPLASVLFRPQGEHFLPALRLLIATNARLFGMDAFAWRLLILASHVASALLLAGVARRYLPSPSAALAAGVAYVLPAGFSSMWVWFPSGGCVPIGLVGITGAMLALASRESLGPRRARWLAGIGVVWAVVFENGLVPLVATPALLDELERRRAGRRKGPVGIFALFCLVLMAGSVLATSVYYRRMTGETIEVHPLPALLRAGFLFLSAPFRLFFPGQHVPRDLGSGGGAVVLLGAFGLVVSLAVAALFAVLIAPRARTLVVTALVAAFGPFGFVGLVAIARSSTTFADLFDSDRYYFPLLIPGALLAGAAFASFQARALSWEAWQRRAVWSLLGALLVVEVGLHSFALRRRVPFGVYAEHANRYQQLARLGEMLSARADALPPGEPPLLFPDGAFYFADVHNRRLSARFLLFVATRTRSPRLALGGVSVDARDEKIVNEVLGAWSKEIGDKERTFRILDGELRDASDTGAVRFGVGPFDSAIVEGFHNWEGALRWAGPHSVLRLRAGGDVLRLRLATPASALASALPGFDGSRVKVGIEDDASGVRSAIGEIVLSGDSAADYVLELPPGLAETIRGRTVRLVLESRPAWRPRDVLPGALDDRLLTFQLYEAAFENRADAGGHSK